MRRVGLWLAGTAVLGFLAWHWARSSNLDTAAIYLARNAAMVEAREIQETGSGKVRFKFTTKDGREVEGSDELFRVPAFQDGAGVIYIKSKPSVCRLATSDRARMLFLFRPSVRPSDRAALDRRLEQLLKE